MLEEGVICHLARWDLEDGDTYAVQEINAVFIERRGHEEDPTLITVRFQFSKGLARELQTPYHL